MFGPRLRTLASVLLVAASVAAADAVRAQDQASSQPLSLAPILERYAWGIIPTTAELSSLAAMAADGRLLTALRTDGSDWLRAGGPAGIRSRRLSLAALVLEVALAQGAGTGRAGRAVIEWVCEKLRESDPLPAERAWFVATVGLMEGSPPFDDLSAHLAHATARFSGEPRLFLADAWTLRPIIPDKPIPELVSARAFFPNAPGPLSTSPYTFLNRQMRNGQPQYSVGFNIATIDGGVRALPPYNASLDMIPNVQPLAPESPSAHALWQSRQDYERARKTPALAAEAELRLGELDLSQAKPKNALRHFQRALDRATDPDLLYLAWSLTGMANQALRRWSAAEAAYRQALVLAPHGRSATTALADLLDRKGKPDEARAVRARVVDPTAIDPWTRFSSGDLLPYPALLEEVRRAVR